MRDLVHPDLPATPAEHLTELVPADLAVAVHVGVFDEGLDGLRVGVLAPRLRDQPLELACTRAYHSDHSSSPQPHLYREPHMVTEHDSAK
jgi:hypothetical protein